MDTRFLQTDPEMAVEGGLPDDFVGTVKEAWTEVLDYGENARDAFGKAVGYKIVIYDEDAEKEYTQIYSVGASDRWAPADTNGIETERGQVILPLKSQDRMNKSCKAFVLMSNLAMIGFDPAPLSMDIRKLIGLKAHWRQMVEEVRQGIGNQENQRPPQVLIPDKLISLPGSGGGSSSGTRSSGGGRRGRGRAAATEGEGEGEDKGGEGSEAPESTSTGTGSGGRRGRRGRGADSGGDSGGGDDTPINDETVQAKILDLIKEKGEEDAISLDLLDAEMLEWANELGKTKDIFPYKDEEKIAALGFVVDEDDDGKFVALPE